MISRFHLFCIEIPTKQSKMPWGFTSTKVSTIGFQISMCTLQVHHNQIHQFTTSSSWRLSPNGFVKAIGSVTISNSHHQTKPCNILIYWLKLRKTSIKLACRYSIHTIILAILKHSNVAGPTAAEWGSAIGVKSEFRLNITHNNLIVTCSVDRI